LQSPTSGSSMDWAWVVVRSVTASFWLLADVSTCKED